MGPRFPIFSTLTALLLLAAIPLVAEANFSGQWTFQPDKGENVEMMRNVQINVTVEQTRDALTVTEVSSVKGREATRKVRYDLTGKEVDNESAMGEASQTTSKWVGSKLETTWSHAGAVAGTQVVSTETRSLSEDGKTMRDEFVRGNRPPVVLVFEKR
jgi:hypothetical protein